MWASWRKEWTCKLWLSTRTMRSSKTNPQASAPRLGSRKAAESPSGGYLVCHPIHQEPVSGARRLRSISVVRKRAGELHHLQRRRGSAYRIAECERSGAGGQGSRAHLERYGNCQSTAGCGSDPDAARICSARHVERINRDGESCRSKA